MRAGKAADAAAARREAAERERWEAYAAPRRAAWAAKMTAVRANLKPLADAYLAQAWDDPIWDQTAVAGTAGADDGIDDLLSICRQGFTAHRIREIVDGAGS